MVFVKGQVFTKEHRKKLSEARRGKIPWNKGLSGIWTEKKNPRWNGGKKLYICAICGKRFLRWESAILRRGETIAYCSIKCYGESKKGKSDFQGKRHSKKAKIKMSKSHLGLLLGRNHPNWKGGRGTERHRLMGQYKYVKWRSQIFERDSYTCQRCGLMGVYLMAHHLKSWIKYPGLRYKLSNGVTLCKHCHAEIDESYRRFYVEKETLN